MKNAEMKVVRFGESDVIATSGLKMEGFGDGIWGNATFDGKALSSYGSTYFYLDITGDDINFYTADGNSTGDLLTQYEEVPAENLGRFNGTYVYHTKDELVCGSSCWTYGDIGLDEGWYKVSQ